MFSPFWDIDVGHGYARSWTALIFSAPALFVNKKETYLFQNNAIYANRRSIVGQKCQIGALSVAWRTKIATA